MRSRAGTFGELWQALSIKIANNVKTFAGLLETVKFNGLIKVIGLDFGQILIGRFKRSKFHK